ncbi:MAG TPA: histidine phosphatase family protein [Povalibacter sp.]|uniref:histidine phosphatase family protein n=1 Tax=Povalibacter sp. TaxID=1962978 RepID=UPI002BE1DC4E|nr:histidine phosphatase family protein [Povalibacter sp.]HMN46958.1 histidine phosphatase family protein [Povalibacter sp.]
MSTLYLVRHGQASFGTDHYDQLSARGREQVKLLGGYFAESGERIDRIYTGTLQRQRETAEIVASALGPAAPPIATEGAFDEYDSDVILREFAGSLTAAQLAEAGWPELRHDRRKFQFFLERAARAWVEARIEAEQMLPWKNFHGRITQALRQIMESEGRSKTLIVSTSGGVIGTTVAHVLGLSNHMGIELNWAVHNASITRLIYSADKVSLSMFNALPHLEREGRRELITYR